MISPSSPFESNCTAIVHDPPGGSVVPTTQVPPETTTNGVAELETSSIETVVVPSLRTSRHADDGRVARDFTEVDGVDREPSVPAAHEDVLVVREVVVAEELISGRRAPGDPSTVPGERRLGIDADLGLDDCLVGERPRESGVGAVGHVNPIRTATPFTEHDHVATVVVVVALVLHRRVRELSAVAGQGRVHREPVRVGDQNGFPRSSTGPSASADRCISRT